MRILGAGLLWVAAGGALGGCQQFGAAVGTFTAVNVVSLTTIGRTAPDAIYYLLSNRDCSAVRLEQRLSFCIPPEPRPAPPEFCTHSLATPDCWTHPELLSGQPRELADSPAPTAAQLAAGLHHWPDL
jgi:hypothetical protein